MPHLDYGDILCDQTFNNSFHENLESIQYNAAVAIIPSATTVVQETLSVFQNGTT